MATKGEKRGYSALRGDSIYPIAAGRIFRLLKRHRRYNKKLKKNVPHQLFLWVKSEGRWIVGKSKATQPLDVWWLYVPVIEGKLAYKYYLKSDATVLRARVMQRLQTLGYELIRGKHGEPFEVYYDGAMIKYARVYKICGFPMEREAYD